MLAIFLKTLPFFAIIGLGYMAGMGIVLWMLGRNLGLRDRNLMRLYYGAPSMREAASFVRTLLLYTVTFEVLGALALFGGFLAEGIPAGQGVWWAVFHAISSGATYTNCLFSGQRALRGGAIFNNSASPTFNNCTIASNYSYEEGAAFFNFNDCNWH